MMRPPLLYKYRQLNGCGLDRLADILVRNELWFSSPQDFNDPFDCFPSIDSSGTDAEVKAWVATRLLRTSPNLNRQQRRAEERRLCKIARDGGLTAELKDGARSSWLNAMSRVGVLSLTAKPDHMLMWGHYADSHRGVCLEFGTSYPPFKRAHEVLYGAERPTYRLMAPRSPDLISEVLLRKADLWRYEEEWRALSMWRPGRALFPPEALTGVVLGANISAEDERAIRTLLAARDAPVPISRAQLDQREYRLKLVPA